LVLLENIEQSSYVRDALLELPERLRDVVTSYFLDGEASSSIADRLGVTESRVSQMRSEALRMLRSAMTAVYADQPAETGGQRDQVFAAQVAGRSSFRDRVTLAPRGAVA
jgi:RNA polymerase sigma factor for flagellar operon FliA